MSQTRKPDWLKMRPPSGERFTEIKQSLRERDLHTVCEEANCPNMGECWSGRDGPGTATFMLMGDRCSRGCNFCDVETGGMEPLDPEEPKNVADAVADMLGEFGDNSDPTDFAGLIIHSKQKTDLFKDDDFTRQDSYGPGNVLARGQIGDIFGIPVIVSDRVTVTAGAPDTYGAILVKRGALGLLYKRRPVVESDRDILRRTTVLTTNVHYAVKRLNDQGVGVLTTQ